MNPAELEDYLHRHIPLSHAMAVSVVSVTDDAITLSAPLEPNINHRETVFGGSASAVATLAAWSLLHVRLRSADLTSQLVIQRNTMDYERPIAGRFQAQATLADTERWAPFLKMLERRGRGRIQVASVLEFEGEHAGRFVGEFVALRDEQAQSSGSR